MDVAMRFVPISVRKCHNNLAAISRSFVLILAMLLVQKTQSFVVSRNSCLAAVKASPGIHSRNSMLHSLKDDELGTFLKDMPLANYLADWIVQAEKTTKPIQKILDDFTAGWALSYADLSPDSERTPAGQLFLATNLAYLLAGIGVFLAGDWWLGFWTDVAAVASFNYHYNQLVAAGESNSETVRLALLLDYTAAGASILTGLAYLFETNADITEPLVYSGIGIGFLTLCWMYEKGRPYMIFHSLWHIFSGYAGYLIGTIHANNIT